MANRWFRHKIAWILLIMMTLDICYPPLAMALTSGPSQPEFQKFTPASATDMVNIFSGDMAYNIPLFELPGPNGGYPLNLSYTSGITMEQEASWVGLGWDLNVGAMNRNMRGVPDEFDGSKGDHITVREDMKRNFTVGLSYSPDFEIFSRDIVDFGSVSVFYNSYKGIGYSIGFGVNIKAFSIGNIAQGGLGLDVTMNTQEGVDISPSISLTSKSDYMNLGMNLGASFNSMQGYKGLGYSMQASVTAKNVAAIKEKRASKKDNGNAVKDGQAKNTKTNEGPAIPDPNIASVSGGFNFGHTNSPVVSPSINSETRGFATNVNVKLGGEIVGGHPNFEAGGFYRQEVLLNKNKPTPYPVYGYNHSDKAGRDPRALMDFNREGDGGVNKYTKSLAIPSYSYDTWTVMGQGIGQMVRPHKANAGFVRDPQRTNKIRNLNLGVDVGGGNLLHGGGSGGFSNSTSRSGAWGMLSGEGRSFTNSFSQTNENFQKDYEPYHYRVHGELRAYPEAEFQKYTAGSSPMRLKRNGLVKSELITSIYEDLSSTYVDKSGRQVSIKNDKNDRVPRSNYVLEVKNEMINKESPIFKEFLIENYTAVENFSSKESLVRNTKAHHIAGFVAYKNDGLRYVYALPVQNKVNIETSFSVKASLSEANQGGNGYTLYRNETSVDDLYKKGGVFSPQRLNETSTPGYAHCFPLTSVLGVDYVDVKNDGITDDDLGYWVKFGYYKDADYKWRMPYSGFNYAPGMLSTAADDMGSYIYGERENYFLRTAETKTHIARFHLKKRLDNLEAPGQGSFISNPTVSGLHGGYCIEKIELFSKAELKANPLHPVPIKTVYFEYDYSLCPGIKNKKSPAGNGYLNAPGSGKLTLKKVKFQYRNNTRAVNNFYEFGYYQGENEGNYNPYAQDIWGTYKHPDGDPEKNFLFPYLDQTNSKANHDRNAAMWNLNQIQLPSGSIIDLEYEMDDYAYVQNKPAMQLYKIDSKTELDEENNTKVYFELPETYISTNTGAGVNAQVAAQKYMSSFLDKSGYVFFKAKIDIHSNNSFEYVSGYAQVDKSNSSTIQIDPDSYDAGKGGYTKGILILKKVKVKDKEFNDHPFRVAAWNFLQLNRPEIIGVQSKIDQNSDADPSEAMIKDMLLSLITPFKGMAVFINGFYGTCRKKDYGSEMHADESYIRLNSQNSRNEIIDIANNERKIQHFKYGGGHRIRKVVLRESAATPLDDAVGVVYDYTIDEGGIITSSGVATFEPSLGGEENALKQPLEFEVDVKIRANYKLFTEMPFNQALYPSASVGYRKVIVRSIATDRVLSRDLSAEIPTTGESVYQFYTAKEFPVITDFTQLDETSTKKSETFYTPMYSSTKDYFRGTQGFSIELNDMHGKPKSIEAFAISKEGKIISDAISGTYYNYKSKRKSNVNGYDAWQLVNEGLDVMDESGRLYNDYIVGLDYEIVNDVRESVSMGYSGNLNVNVDAFVISVVPLVILTLPLAIPNFSVTESVVQTAVTNKIIYRTGLVDETIQMTDGATVSTKTKVLDKLTGQPIVQTIINEYGNILESSTTPAYWHYEEMGPVYKRIGIKDEDIPATVIADELKPGNFLLRVARGGRSYRIGDEVSVKCTFSGSPFHSKGTIVNQSGRQMEIDVRGVSDAFEGMSTRCDLFLYRPIDRNQLDVMIGSKTILK